MSSIGYTAVQCEQNKHRVHPYFPVQMYLHRFSISASITNLFRSVSILSHSHAQHIYVNAYGVHYGVQAGMLLTLIILEWTTSLDTSSRTLFVRLWGCPRHVERRVTQYSHIVIERRVT